MIARWFGRGDVDGLFGLALDNMLMLILMSNFCLGFPLFFPAELFYTRILPAAGLGVVIGNVYYFRQALQLARREGRSDVCALPFGINVVSLVAFVFLVLYPAKFMAEAQGLSAEDSALFSWRAGILACFVSGLIEFCGAFVAGRIRALTPRAALLSAIAGIGLCFLAMDFFFRAFAYPMLGFLTFGLAIILYFGQVRLKFGIPCGLVLMVAGTGLAWMLHFSGGAQVVPVGDLNPRWLGLHLPVPVVGDLLTALPQLWAFIPIILPVGCLSVIISLQNIESAEAAGDSYPTLPCMLYNGISSIATGLFGSPFPTSIYIGHPGWKAIGAGPGYSLANAMLIGGICFTGTLSFVVYFVPVEAGMAVLIWVGIAMAAQAFEATPRRHAPAVVIGLMPAIAAFCALLVKRTIGALGYGSAAQPFPADMPALFADARDFFVGGTFALEQGYVFTSMILAAATAMIIDGRFRAAAAWFALGAVLSSIGFIHRYQITQADVVGTVGLVASSSALCYGLLALAVLAVPLVSERSTESSTRAPHGQLPSDLEPEPSAGAPVHD